MADLGVRGELPVGELLVAAAAALVCGDLAVLAPKLLLAAGLGLLALVLLLRMPRVWMPSLALALYALVPLHYLPVPETASTVSPSLLVALLWVGRLRRDRPETRRSRDGLVLGAAALVVVGLLVASTLHGGQTKTGVGWSFAFSLNVLLVAGGLRREDPRARELVVTTWTGLAAVLGAYAVVEAFVLKHNPVFDVTTRLGGSAVEQVWATYRATTTLGHPLENAAFFALGACLALARAVRTGSRLDALKVVVAFAGLAATGSRGPGAAALLGVVWVLVAEARHAPRRRVAAVAFTLVLAAGGAGLVQLTRSGSAEADSSTKYRTATLQTGLASVREHPWLGVGPGASAVVKQEEGGSLATLSYENGWLEAAISDGLPFLLVLAGTWAVGIVVAGRRRHVAAGSALLVSVLVMGSSNVLEGGREGLLRFGLLLGLAWAPRAAQDIAE